MSQEKVDRYKQEKANRKQTMRKQKMMHVVRNTVMVIIAVALIGWLGYSAVGIYEDKQPRQIAEVDYTAVDNYLNTLDASEAE